MLTKTNTGYVKDESDIYTFEMHYDSNGRYVGQKQTNVLDDGPDFFFEAEIINGIPCVDGHPVADLTQEEMSKAN